MDELAALDASLAQLGARLRERNPEYQEVLADIEENAVFLAWGMFARRLDLVARHANAPIQVSVHVRRLLSQTLAHAPLDARTITLGLMACRAVQPPDLTLLGVRVMPFSWWRLLRFTVVMAVMIVPILIYAPLQQAAQRAAGKLATADITLPFASLLVLVPAVFWMLYEHDKRRLWGAMLGYARRVTESTEPLQQAVVILGRSVIGGGTRLLKRVVASLVTLGFLFLLTRVYGWNTIFSGTWMLSVMFGSVLVYQVVLYLIEPLQTTASREFRETLEQVQRWRERTIEDYARTPGPAGEDEGGVV